MSDNDNDKIADATLPLPAKPKRQTKNQFEKGNTASKGFLWMSRVKVYREAIYKCITPEEMAKLARVVYGIATESEDKRLALLAVDMLFKYCSVKPPEQVDIQVQDSQVDRIKAFKEALNINVTIKDSDISVTPSKPELPPPESTIFDD